MDELVELATIISEKLGKAIESVELIIVYGSVARRSTSPFSDLDMITFFSSEKDKNQHKNQVNLNFLFKGHPIDAWANSFENLKQIQSDIRNSMWLYPISGLLDCQIMYAKNTESRQWFLQFQQNIRLTINDHKNNIVLVKKGFQPWDIFRRLNYARKNNDWVSGRFAIWELLMNIITIYARLNDTYLKKNWGSNMHEAFTFSILPPHFERKVDLLIKTLNWDELEYNAQSLTEITQKEIEEEYIANQPLPTYLMGEELVGGIEYLNKVRSACERQDILTASYAATEFQIWMADRVAFLEYPQVSVSEYLPFSQTASIYESHHLPDFQVALNSQNWEELVRLCDIAEQQLIKIGVKTKNELTLIDDFKNLPFHLD